MEDSISAKKKKSYSVLFEESRWFSQWQWWAKYTEKHSWATPLTAIDPSGWFFIWVRTLLRCQGSQAASPALHHGRAALGKGSIIPTVGFGAWTDLCSGFLPSCITCSLGDECTLWSPVYLLYLFARRRQQTRLLLRKSSQLVLQSVTRKVLINGDFLIELKD